MKNHYSVKREDGRVIGIAHATKEDLEGLVMKIAEEEYCGDDSRMQRSISPRVFKYGPVDVEVEILFDDDEWVAYDFIVEHVNIYE